MQYTDFQNMPSSEKLVLAILGASRRLMGWSVHSGSVYKIENFKPAVVVSLEDSGTAYTQVSSVGSVIAGTYYLDHANETIYVRTSASDNPNGRFLVATVNFFFANAPVVLPYDLDTGADVYFEPLIRSNSDFGVEIDTIAQTSEAIEGSGSLTLENDFDFWPENFDKYAFENQRVRLYSYNRDLPVDQKRLIFKGKIEKKTYSKNTITFQLKDQFAELRATIPLETIGSLDERTGDDLEDAKQRMILGRVFGNVPTNIDQVLDGYPITGTVSVSVGSATVTGSSTTFLAELSPDDQLVLDGVEYTVATVVSNTSLTLTEEYAGAASLSGALASVVPDKPKRWLNRRFKIAGHALRQPTTTTVADSSITVLRVVDASDIYADDIIYVGDLGSGELVTVRDVIGTDLIRLSTSLATPPDAGVTVTKPAVQNVRIDNVLLQFYRDYTVDATNAELTLLDTAESNACPIFQLSSNATFTNGSRTVTGSGFRGIINASYMVGISGNADFFEVLSVDSDTQITLRTASTFTGTSTLRYKSLVYDHGETVLSLDVMGRTEDGTSSGAFLDTAPSITKALLADMGLSSEVNEASFTSAEEIAYQQIGIVVPASFDDRSTFTYRDVINKVNKSVFGTLVQNEDFEFTYHVLMPDKTPNARKFTESDFLSFSLNSTAEYVVKTCIVEYKPKEYDYLTKDSSISTSQKTSDDATYVLKTDRTKTITTYLVDSTVASITAARWSFILSNSTSRLTFNTKLQAADLAVGDIVEIEHRKFFERFGGSGKRKLLLIEGVARSGEGVRVEATDLSNTFNRVAAITDHTDEYVDASETEKLYGGYYTDTYGLIDNDPETFGTNLIW